MRPRIVLWGMGQKFHLIWPEFKLLEIEKKIDIIAFADRKKDIHVFDGKPVMPPERIAQETFDFLVVVSQDFEDEMRSDALRQGIPKERIMTPYMFLWKGFPHDYRFVNRQTSSRELLLVVAGWHPVLWKAVFSRIERFLPGHMDVCVVIPGTESEHLRKVCEKNGWSCLETKENKLALAQNLAIELHPDAKFIYKIDEDVFITQNFFFGLKEAYQEAVASRAYKVGFVAPVLNVNGFGYRKLLESVGRLDEYEARFGDAVYAAGEIPATMDPQAAKYLWEIVFPLDETARRMASGEEKFSICHHRFSIGAMFFSREMWEGMGGFRVSNVDGMLGLEEAELCKHCMHHSLAIVCANRVLAGHLSFGGRQRSFMNQYYLEHEEKFMPEG